MPNVHLASPGVRQLSASSAACWSTISPATGIVGPKTSVLPTIWSQPTISGSASPVSPNRPSRSSSHATVSSAINSDRLAVEASVTNAPHSRCTSQVSVVVTTPAVVMFARIHAILGAEKYGSSTRPVRWATVSADADSDAQIDSARRSCHTTAGVSGRPVSRSQASTVSPWLARATAATGTPACAKACRPASTTESNSASGSCSTPPPARYSGRTATSAIDTTRPESSTTMALVPEVPWSIARKCCMPSPLSRPRPRCPLRPRPPARRRSNACPASTGRACPG